MGTPGTFNSDQWNSQTFNGPPGSGGGTVATTLGSLLSPMLRIAGITKRPGITPSSDQFAELIPMVNRMLASWNCDGHRIFETSIDSYDIGDGSKIYKIGPGATFDNPRPLHISLANVIFPTSPAVRRPIRILDKSQWSSITVQDVAGAPPTYLYYDYGFDENGWAQIYIRPQAPTGYSLELYTWLAIKASFTAVDDAVTLPPGYEEAIVWNGAIKAAGMYPLESHLDPTAGVQADRSLQTLVTYNSKCPPQPNESGYLGRGGGYYNYMSGQIEGGH